MKSKDTVLKVTIDQIDAAIAQTFLNQKKNKLDNARFVLSATNMLIESDRQNHVDWEKVKLLKKGEHEHGAPSSF